MVTSKLKYDKDKMFITIQYNSLENLERILNCIYQNEDNKKIANVLWDSDSHRFSLHDGSKDIDIHIDDYVVFTESGILSLDKQTYSSLFEAADSECSIGTLYDMNKEIIKQEGKLSKSKIRDKFKKMKTWLVNKQFDTQYFMLLCRERYDYTVFNTKEKDFDTMTKEIQAILENRSGIFHSIDETKNKDAYELWVNIDGEMFMYYLFPYDWGVIEV
jgi:hypothetical protein